MTHSVMSTHRPAAVRFREWSTPRGVAKTAAALGIRPEVCSRLRGGSQRPSLELAARIERLSGGYVRASEWVASAEGRAPA